jgi:hypothetical protein
MLEKTAVGSWLLAVRRVRLSVDSVLGEELTTKNQEQASD